MPHDPLEALRKAQSIGANPLAEENWMRGEMPLGSGMIAGLAGRVTKALEGLRRAGPTINLAEEAAPVAQVTPRADDVMALIQSLRHNLSRVPQAGSRPLDPRITGLTPSPAPPTGLRAPVDPYAEDMFRRYISQKVR